MHTYVGDNIPVCGTCNLCLACLVARWRFCLHAFVSRRHMLSTWLVLFTLVKRSWMMLREEVCQTVQAAVAKSKCAV